MDIIKKDIINSKHLSNAFNTIYNKNNNLFITTDGICNISTKTADCSNTDFNSKFN